MIPPVSNGDGTATGWGYVVVTAVFALLIAIALIAGGSSNP